MIHHASPLPEPAWGLLIGLYFVMVGLPTGLTLMTSWVTANGRRGDAAAIELERICAWAGLGILGIASLLLVIDLHRPERFFLMLTEFGNLGSPISVGAKLIAVKMFLLVVLLYFLRLQTVAGPASVPRPGHTRWAAHMLTVTLVFVSIALALYPIGVLSFTWTSPLARTSGAFMIFFITTLLMGAAGIIAITGAVPSVARLREPMSQIAIGLVGLHVVTLIFEGWAATADPRLPDDTVGSVLSGDDALLFWGGTLCLAIAVALLSAPRPRNSALVRVAAGTLLLAGAGITRYLFFAVGT